MTSVAIVGSGYVGLVTGAGLADIGHDVICVDRDEQRLETISRGEAPIHEPGLQDLLARNIGRRLTTSSDLAAAVASSAVIFIAVGTPSSASGMIDLSQVAEAGAEIGAALGRNDSRRIVVIKSTVVPGSTETTIIPILEAHSGLIEGRDFSVVVNPEFLTEGTAIEDFLKPDRIVVGSNDLGAAQSVLALYEPLGSVPSILTGLGTAEMIKYASNTLLATLISFSNELADIAEMIEGVDLVEVMKGVHNSRYMTVDGQPAPISAFLEAGCGFGGSCLPKDTKALIAHARSLNVSTPMLEAVLDINARRAERMVQITHDSLGGLDGRRLTILGLAFKPDSDDVRESPAFPIIERLLDRGAVIVTHDPVVGPSALPDSIRESVSHVHDLTNALADSDAVLIVTKWDEYRQVPMLLEELGISPKVIDGRRLLPGDSVASYSGVGL